MFATQLLGNDFENKMVVRELCWVQNRSFGATTLHKPTTFCGAAQVEYFVLGRTYVNAPLKGSGETALQGSFGGFSSFLATSVDKTFRQQLCVVAQIRGQLFGPV